MKIIFFGTGSSQGIPVISCNCKVCMSSDLKDIRTRSSVFIEINKLKLIIDTGPDFRQQMLRESKKFLDAVLITHDHTDHIFGLDDIRPLNISIRKQIEIYGELYVLNTLKKVYSYAFAETKYPGAPDMKLIEIGEKQFKIKSTIIIPIRGYHYKLPMLGFRIGNFAYLTDINFIEQEEREKLKNLEVLVVTALRKEKHWSHLNLKEALQLIEELKPKKAYLSHISHQLGLYETVSKQLPDNIFLSYDGLKIEVN